MKKEYMRLEHVEGSMIELDHLHHVGFGEVVEIKSLNTGKEQMGQVAKINGNSCVPQVFGDNLGTSTKNQSVTFLGKPSEIPVSKEVLGRVFNGVGEPIDEGGPIYSDKSLNINERPMNPVSRQYPRDFIQTRISSIDALMTLIRGQKLPIFSGSGLPHNKLAAQIVRQTKITGDAGEDSFVIVFAAIGVKHDETDYFQNAFRNSGVSEKVVMYINYVDGPIMERLIVPKCTLTVAEYLAYEEKKHVLVIMTDITSYAEALREVSSSREEVPSRRGYPGHLYSDLAVLYKRAGMIQSIDESVTLIPILTVPNDNITRSIADLTGHITKGWTVLSRDLAGQGLYPPIQVLPSLSRFIKDGIGEGYTRKDHNNLSSQLFASYPRVQEVRALAQIIRTDDLSQEDQVILRFGQAFEGKFINQGNESNRDIETTLDLGWELLRLLPETNLGQISPELKEEFLRKKDE